ncbi:glycosyltransferase family 2 protein [Exiguobacterium sp. 9-2]|uniref:glycosyltransferase family 2 protein n=1 Tax=Exiguobacterium sp. 9-2 TaxID=3112419 RepID=UPI002E381A64|nr:glycosyltransferase family 2 protein [Exiguobacterium sp. 9-2]
MVSVIIPTYNSAKYLKRTIDSVLKQTYQNFQIIIIDDCSQDETKKIVENYQKKFSEIKYILLDKNSGAAVARNTGIKKAEGKYLAFLDSDDVWFEDKLEIQLKYMRENKLTFTCTNYNKIDENDIDLNKEVLYPTSMTYEKLLKNNCGNSTVIYDCQSLGKTYIEDIKKRNDYVMWLKVIKKSGKLHNVGETLSSHRIRSGSISSNKIDLVKYHWYVYRKIEDLNFMKSVYLTFYWIVKKVFTKG